MHAKRFADPTLTDADWTPPSLCGFEAVASVASTVLADVFGGGGRDEPDTSDIDAQIAARNAEAQAEDEEQRRRLELRQRLARQGGSFQRLLLTRGGERGLLG